MKRFFIHLVLFCFALSARAELSIELGVYRVDKDERLPLSRLDIPPDDLGFAGLQLGVEDNETTGGFLGHVYTAKSFAGADEAVREAVASDYEAGLRIFVLDAPEGTLTALADQYADALLINVAAEDNSLRNENCRANLLHIAPSHAQRTDAVLQFLMWKKWPEIFLIYGSHEEDSALAESYRASATKFGAKITAEKEFTDTGGARQTDTGMALVQKQIPLFTQDAKGHDVIVAADASEIFAGYLPYRTWEPDPVFGSAGLSPVTWTASMDAWGAEQMQRRFEKNARRLMRERDYQYWLALRVIGEAVTRTNSAEAGVLRDYILSEDFTIAAFKGVPLSFRNWNGQLRQPVLLSDGHLPVSVSPQEGYLHQFSELDTLGFDQGESRCQAFQ